MLLKPNAAFGDEGLEGPLNRWVSMRRLAPAPTVQPSRGVGRGQALADFMYRFVLAEKMVLPLDSVTRRFAVFAPITGPKTHAATVLVEEMVSDQLPVVVLDPLGVWHGLGWATDGEAPGLPVRVLGGPHGGLELREHSGGLVADLAVDLQQPVVVDLSSLSPSGSKRFVADFAEQLALRKPRTMHLVVDRADEFLQDEAGRGGGPLGDLFCSTDAGLGLTLVSDSPASINPDILAHVEALIAARTSGPEHRAAIRSWLGSRVDASAARRVLETLASLEPDETWICSPSWLGVLERVTLRHRATYGGLGARSDRLRPPQSRAAGVELRRLQARLKGVAAQTAAVPISPRQSRAWLEGAVGAPDAMERESPRRLRRGRPVEALVLGQEERTTLQRYAKQVVRAPQLSIRARIVLACAEGRLNGEVARDLGISIQMVGRWRRRFVQERLPGLEAPMPAGFSELPVRAGPSKTAAR